MASRPPRRPKFSSCLSSRLSSGCSSPPDAIWQTVVLSVCLNPETEMGPPRSCHGALAIIQVASTSSLSCISCLSKAPGFKTVELSKRGLIRAFQKLNCDNLVTLSSKKGYFDPARPQVDCNFVSVTRGWRMYECRGGMPCERLASMTTVPRFVISPLIRMECCRTSRLDFAVLYVFCSSLMLRTEHKDAHMH